MRTSIQPGYAASEYLHREFTIGKVAFDDICNFNLPPRGGFEFFSVANEEKLPV